MERKVPNARTADAACRGAGCAGRAMLGLLMLFLFGLSWSAPNVPAAKRSAKAAAKPAAATDAPKPAAVQADTAAGQSQEYRIDKPGTITFTVTLKIKGKVEKPQVMIFLPKERPVYEPVTFSRSFVKEIMQPLPFVPMEP